MPARFAVWLLLAILLAAGCRERQPLLPRVGDGDVILAFGDSLTYGTGAGAGESYPAILERITGRIVIGAGVPGEVTEDALRRLPGALDAHQPKVLLLCIGGNDMLRQVDESRIAANLRAMIELASARGVGVLLIGVPKPRLLGGSPAFYADLAEEFRLPYEGEIVRKLLYDNGTKSDMIHPNAEGYRLMAEAIAELLRDSGAL